MSLDIDYEAWAKEALANVVDEEMREKMLQATVIGATLTVRALAGQNVDAPALALKAAVQNLVTAGTIATASEAEDLMSLIFEELGEIVINLGKKAIGLA